MHRLAIVGRPNVGKSTLFNRLAGRRLAMVHDQPGVTRDRRETLIRFAGRSIELFDTAGFEDATDESLEARMRRQTERAIEKADLALLVIDARSGITGLDEIFASALRRSGRPILVIANKVEGRAAESGVTEAYSLGLGDPVAISAEHGLGIDDLEEAVSKRLPEAKTSREESAIALARVSDGGKRFEDGNTRQSKELDCIHERCGHDDGLNDIVDAEAEGAALSGPLHIAIVGRPNAGKSTLINYLLGEDRMLTGPEAGITRDTIATDWSWRGRTIRLYDTAGMRRRARIVDRIEKLSVSETLNAVRFAHIVILMIDADSPLDRQDLHIADLVAREGRVLVMAVNKIDTVDDPGNLGRHIRVEADRLLPQMRGLPVFSISAKTGQGVGKVLDSALRHYEIWNLRISTAALNRWLDDVLGAHPPPAPGGRRIKIRYITQAKSRPPTFVAFCSRPDALPASYKRYLVNGLREAFGFSGVPVRLNLKKGENPYVRKK